MSERITEKGVTIEFGSPRIGSCGGDDFGDDGLYPIEYLGETVGLVRDSWNTGHRYIELGDYPHEWRFPTNARTNKSVAREAALLVLGWVARDAYERNRLSGKDR